MIEKILEYTIAPVLMIGILVYLNTKYHFIKNNPVERAKYLEGKQKEQDILWGKGTPFRYVMIPILIIAFLCIVIALVSLLIKA
jgi:hypothetical protein